MSTTARAPRSSRTRSRTTPAQACSSPKGRRPLCGRTRCTRATTPASSSTSRAPASCLTTTSTIIARTASPSWAEVVLPSAVTGFTAAGRAACLSTRAAAAPSRTTPSRATPSRASPSAARARPPSAPTASMAGATRVSMRWRARAGCWRRMISTPTSRRVWRSSPAPLLRYARTASTAASAAESTFLRAAWANSSTTTYGRTRRRAYRLSRGLTRWCAATRCASRGWASTPKRTLTARTSRRVRTCLRCGFTRAARARSRTMRSRARSITAWSWVTRHSRC
mmetsp:Transcript_17744/g.53019  ORF Transcript_17744/g.53019 Transcript_17744/m.53019 type:complete len:282 (+) Transcript_17744:362-1207(+)